MSPDPALPAAGGPLQAEIERLRGLLAAAGLDPDGGRQGPPAPAAIDPGDPAVARLLLDTMSEGFYVVDRAGLTTVCNTAMLRLLGFEGPHEVIGQPLHDIIHHSHPDGSHYPAEDCPIYRAARDGLASVVAGERFFRKDGTSFPVEYRAEPLVRGGRLEGAVCTFVDITARMEGEQRLRESEERLALATAAGGIGVWDYDSATRTLRWDERVRDLFGLDPSGPVTLQAYLAAVHPEDRAGMRHSLGAALDPAGEGACRLQFRTLDADGGTRWVDLQGAATFRNGKPARLLGVLRDITGDKEAERHLRLMVNELNHRVKNSLAMVQAVAAQTFRDTDDMAGARTSFTERLVALARAHDVLTATNWDGADLREVVALTARTHAGEEAERFEVTGASLLLSPKAALAFALALHELATNAVKYGALANGTGRVEIRWERTASDAGDRLRFTWRERGGPPVAPPRRRGFGSKLIERGLASELQGTVRIGFHNDGVTCSIEAPFPSTAHGSMP